MYEFLLITSVVLRALVYLFVSVVFVRAKDYAMLPFIALLIIGSIASFLPPDAQAAYRLILGDLLAPAFVFAVLMGKRNRL